MEKMQSVILDDRTIEYKIIREKRKTIKIAVSLLCDVVVTIPQRMPLSEINVQIVRHSEWLLKRLEQYHTLQAEYKDVIDLKSAILYGTRYTICSSNNEKKHAQMEWDGECVHATNCAEKLRVKLLDFYKKETKASLDRMIPNLTVRIGAKPASYCAKGQRRLWGSCNSKKELRFNQLLCMLPVPVIEYVVVHELCHLKHMNHSDAFWYEVARILPDYEARRCYLREYGDSLAAVYSEKY